MEEDQDRYYGGHYLVPNCLQKLSALTGIDFIISVIIHGKCYEKDSREITPFIQSEKK